MNFGGKSRFPIITFPETDKESMLFYLEKQLKYEGAQNVVRRGDLIIFSGSIFSLRRLRTFLIFGGKGFLRVTTEGEKTIVTYRLSFIIPFLLYSAGVIFLSSMFIKQYSFIETLFYALVIFCVIFGFIVLTQLVSLAMFIERTFDAFMKK
jgi:hypothetical protein